MSPGRLKDAFQLYLSAMADPSFSHLGSVRSLGNPLAQQPVVPEPVFFSHRDALKIEQSSGQTYGVSSRHELCICVHHSASCSIPTPSRT